MIALSSGLKSLLVSEYGIRYTMQGGVIAVYGCDRPASPDLAPVAEPIGYITQDGAAWSPGSFSALSPAGLQLYLYSSGVLARQGIWILTGRENGTAKWFRYYWGSYDPRTDSVDYPRIDGDVGSDLILPSTQITPTTRDSVGTVYFFFA